MLYAFAFAFPRCRCHPPRISLCCSRHRHASCGRESVDHVGGPTSTGGSGMSPAGGRIYASPTHLRSVCPSAHHLHCDKYDPAGAYWFEASLRPSPGSTAANPICWNQAVKFLPPSDEDLLSVAHDPYSVDRNWTSVSTGSDPVTAVNL